MLKSYQTKAPGIRSVSTTLAVIGVLASLGALVFIRFYMRNTVESYAEKSFSEFAAFKELIERADQLTLLEGLPNPQTEPDLYLLESIRPDKQSFPGEYASDAINLYTDPLPVGPLETMQLTNILTNARYIAKNVPGKACSSFHADYGIQFMLADRRAVYAFICFTCSELQFSGELPAFTCSLTEEGADELKAILAPNAQNRPGSQQKSFFEQALELNEQAPSR